MKHSELITKITKLKGFKPKFKDLAQILDKPVGTINSRSSRDLSYSIEELKKISEAYNIDLLNECWKDDYIETLANDFARDKIQDISTGNASVKVAYRPNVYLSAGYGIEVADEKAEYMVLDKRLFFTDRGLRINPKNCEIVAVSGNSMAPEYRHGDRVIIDKSVTDFTDGHIFAFRYNGECYIKEINLLGNRIKAVPLNKEYDSFYIEKGEDVKILGRIIPRVRL